MEVHRVRVHPAAARLPREAQLAWKLAAFASGAPTLGVDPDVAEMVAFLASDKARNITGSAFNVSGGMEMR